MASVTEYCWAAGDASPVTFEYCWAFGQPGPKATAQSDGNGFKLGSPASCVAGGNAEHKLVDCFAFHNRSAGFTANGNSSGKITCTNCGTWGNGTAARVSVLQPRDALETRPGTGRHELACETQHRMPFVVLTVERSVDGVRFVDGPSEIG